MFMQDMYVAFPVSGLKNDFPIPTNVVQIHCLVMSPFFNFLNFPKFGFHDLFIKEWFRLQELKSHSTDFKL